MQSAVTVNLGINQPTLYSIQEELGDSPIVDRTRMKGWDDENFVTAVTTTNRT